MSIKKVFKSEEARNAFLSSTRKEMYSALNLFHEHVRYTISLMFTLLTAVFAILGLGNNAALSMSVNNPYILKLTASVILFLLFPLGIIFIAIIGRYYRLYVAALVFAAEAHETMELDQHLWFEEIKLSRQKLGNQYTKNKLISSRVYQFPNGWILYSMLIGTISIAGLFLGVTILSTS